MSCRRLEAGHQAGGREHFYEVRNERFNPVRREVHASGRPADRYTPALAAMLIYLNRAGYNGLFRVNSQGAFNVPAGRHASLRICDPDNLRRLSTALRTPTSVARGAAVSRRARRGGRGGFRVPRSAVCAGQPDGVLHVVHDGGFRARATGGAAARGDRSRGRGAHVLLSNSVAPEISALYEDNVEARARRPDGVPGRGAAGHQLLGVRGAGRCSNTSSPTSRSTGP